MTFSKRKRFWVDAPLQLQMVAYALFLVVSSLLLVAFSVRHGLTEASAESRQIFHSIDWVRQTVLGPLLLSSCVAILATGLVVLLWSHRFAGPLRVLSAGFSRLKGGDLSTPVRVRATDAHQDLIREFSEAQDALKSLLKKERDRAHAVAKKLEGKPSHSELEKAAEELKNLLSDFQL